MRHSTKGRWVKVTFRMWCRDGHTGYNSFTILMSEGQTPQDMADYVERQFREHIEDEKINSHEYPHNGSVKFKIISVDGVKFNRIVE